jgi:hypothetical protein
MKDANELHNESMDRAESALLARMRGEHGTADDLFAESLRLESIGVHSPRLAAPSV